MGCGNCAPMGKIALLQGRRLCYQPRNINRLKVGAIKMQGKQTAAMGAVILAALGFWAALSPANADVPREATNLGQFSVTLHVHPFLTEADLGILRMIAASPDALALFMPDTAGYSAMAASPDDGFLQSDQPAASVSALGGLPDAATAAQNAMAACQKASKSTKSCVLLLEVAPN